MSTDQRKRKNDQGAISVSAGFYTKIRAYADRNGKSVAQVVECVVNGAIDEEEAHECADLPH